MLNLKKVLSAAMVRLKEHADLGDRWSSYGQAAIAPAMFDLRWAPGKPELLKNVRLDAFQADFRIASTTATWVGFVFNAKDQDEYNYARIAYSTTATAPMLIKVTDGGNWTDGTGWTSGTGLPVASLGNDLWIRITCNGTSVIVYMATSEAGLDTAYPYCSAGTATLPIDGGRFGFITLGANETTVDDLTIRRKTGASYTTEMVDQFTAADGTAKEEPVHDAAGNLTYDGRYGYTYDAWNRMVGVKRGYRIGSAAPTLTATVGIIKYDGLGRRIMKIVGDDCSTTDVMGDWEATYEFYYDGWSVIETRDGSNDVLKQHLWGVQYIDELVQVALNDDPTDGGEDTCETTYYALQDANYNLMGIVESDGSLKERYEYTPYGQRTVFKSAGSDDPLCMSPLMSDSQPWEVSSVAQPYGICDIGHQGLFFDKEWGLYYNRARMMSPTLGRFLQQDPIGYAYGTHLSQYVLGSPTYYVDPEGLWPFKFTYPAGNPVHESMSWTAATVAGYSDKADAEFMEGLRQGSIYPDAPDGKTKFLGSFTDVKAGFDKETAARNNGARTTYRSHFGDLQYWHGMAVPGKTCEENAKLIEDWIVGQYAKALAADNARNSGMELGKALHTLQDTYSPSHTARTQVQYRGQTLLTGITRFQDYAAQDESKHAAAENFKDNSDGLMNAANGMATFQSAKALEMLRKRVPDAEFRKWLTQGPAAPLRLSDLCVCGGTEPQ